MNKFKLSVILILALALGSGWYVWQDWNKPLTVTDAPLESQVKDNLPLVKPEQKQNQEVDLKARALEIASRPIKVSASLSESQKNQALAKLSEIIGMIKENYDSSYVWLDLGAYRVLIGDYAGAIEAYKFLTVLRPNDFVAYHNLGDLYSAHFRDYPKAEQNFLQSIQVNPANINGYLQLADMYENYYKEKSAEAEKILLDGLRANPNNPNLKSALDDYYKLLESRSL